MDINTAKQHMTEDMLAALSETVTDLELTICEEIGMIRTCREAGNISLPATAESGKPVVHGTRLAMHRLEQYWTHRYQESLGLLYVVKPWRFQELRGLTMDAIRDKLMADNNFGNTSS